MSKPVHIVFSLLVFLTLFAAPASVTATSYNEVTVVNGTPFVVDILVGGEKKVTLSPGNMNKVKVSGSTYIVVRKQDNKIAVYRHLYCALCPDYPVVVREKDFK